MLDSQIFHGVRKSGSPTPREITSPMVKTRSKNFLIPDGGISSARLETKLRIEPPLRRIGQAFRLSLFKECVAVLLIRIHYNVCRGLPDPVHGRNMFGNKPGNFP